MERAPATRIAAAIIALVAWTGLGVQFAASLSQIGAPMEALSAMLRYFTVIVNLLVAIVFTASALGARIAPRWLGGVTMAIMLVGVVYHLLLAGMFELSGGAKLADTLNHSVTPVLVGVYWLILAPKGGLRRVDPLIWGSLPLAYFAYALVRGSMEGIYAYPFLDVATLGWPQTLGNAAIMALGFMIAGHGLVWLDRRLA